MTNTHHRYLFPKTQKHNSLLKKTPSLHHNKSKKIWHSLKHHQPHRRKLSIHEFGRKMKHSPELFNQFWNGVDSSLSYDGKDANVFQSTGSASTYGDMSITGFLKMYSECERTDAIYNHHRILNKKHKIFYDLGSGLGKPTILAGLFIPHLQMAKGIELSMSRHNGAMAVLNRIKQQCDLQEKVRLVNGDILSSHFHYGNADIIWISSLCFSNEIAERLANKLNHELKEGTHVFTSKALHLKNKFHQSFDVEMSWTKQSNLHHYIISK